MYYFPRIEIGLNFSLLISAKRPTLYLFGFVGFFQVPLFCCFFFAWLRQMTSTASRLFFVLSSATVVACTNVFTKPGSYLAHARSRTVDVVALSRHCDRYRLPSPSLSWLDFVSVAFSRRVSRHRHQLLVSIIGVMISARFFFFNILYNLLVFSVSLWFHCGRYYICCCRPSWSFVVGW